MEAIMRYAISMAVTVFLLMGIVFTGEATLYAPRNNIQKMSLSSTLVLYGECGGVEQIEKGKQTFVKVTLRILDDGVIVNKTTKFKDLKDGDQYSFKQFQGMKMPGGIARTSLPPVTFIKGDKYVVFFAGDENNMHIRGVYDGVFTVKDDQVSNPHMGKLFRGLEPTAGTSKALKAAGVSPDAPAPKSVGLDGFKGMIKAFEQEKTEGGAK